MLRIHRSPDYNWEFNTVTGLFKRWGKELKNDPQFSPIGPEILDIEVSTICHQGCSFCYKNNAGNGKNMSFETFKNIFDKIKGNLTQVAFGIGDLTANKELNLMMRYCRDNGVIPNITINGYTLSNDWAEYLASICGAVSVSNYNKDVCYNAVKMLTDKGLKQVNIHQLLSYDTMPQIWGLYKDYFTDPRLEKLNAIVFLSLKRRGRGINCLPVTIDQFDMLVKELLEHKVRIGFDSCSATKFLQFLKHYPGFKKDYPNIEECIEPCESGLFSSYINVEGKFFPCSFTEDGEGLDVVNCKDFLKDIWYHPTTVEWRKKLIDCKRSCPVYRI